MSYRPYEPQREMLLPASLQVSTSTDLDGLGGVLDQAA
jgi:hypothetical protein